MFKISIVESRGQRRLILEGKLVSPWTSEVEKAWENAREGLQGRESIVDLTNVTLISSDGEKTLVELMTHGARFYCSGVLIKQSAKATRSSLPNVSLRTTRGTDRAIVGSTRRQVRVGPASASAGAPASNSNSKNNQAAGAQS